MKDFIVITAILPILLLFMLQFTLDFRNGEQLEVIQNIMYTAKEEAKQAGGFDTELKEKICSQISEKLDIPRENITFWASEGKKYRFKDDRLIRYKLDVKLENVMAGGRMMGISEEENSFIYTIESSTASEYLGE